MGLGENLRYRVFWFFDFLKGNPLKQHLNYNRYILQKIDISGVENEGNKKLSEILLHATSSTEFYKAISPESLDNFPIINKNIMRDNLQSFISKKVNLRKCIKVSTSGSTGAPFTIFQNKEKINKNVVDNIFFSAKSNFKIGNHLVYVKIWKSSFNLKMRYSFIMKNIYPCSIFNLSDSEIDNLIMHLNRSKSPVNFIGYSSAFKKICKHLDELDNNPIRFKTISLITISESLSSYTREAVHKYFGVLPISRYSNNENGIIAQQIRADDMRFRINESSYYAEIFDVNSDKKLSYNQRGRIVITDLFNKINPMIRYDTGDIGVMVLGDDGKQYFSEVYGRKLDLIYDTKGDLVPSHISAKLVEYGDFKQFQLVQKGLKDYEINLNTIKKVDEKMMSEEYKRYLGVDANIKINYVSEIPVLASGKRREVVNEYYNLL